MNYLKKDIDKVYSDVVLDYLNKGYTIYTPELSGNQGEESKVGLTNGKEVVVVYMDNTHDYKEWIDSKLIVVGKVSDYIPYKSYGTIWLNELETIKTLEFYQIRRGNLFTDDKQCAKDCDNLHYKRIENRKKDNRKQFISNKALNIAYKICKRTKGYKSVAKKDIICIYKVDNKFYIEINGKDSIRIK